MHDVTTIHSPPAFAFTEPDTPQECDLPDPPLAPFSPSPQQRAEVLRDLCDPYHSLLSVALKHGTQLESLVAWMAGHDADASLNTLEHAAARHARLAALTQLPRVIPALVATVRAYEHEENDVPLGNSDESNCARHRQREAGRRAAALLARVATLVPPDARRAAGLSAPIRGGSVPQVTRGATAATPPAPSADPPAPAARSRPAATGPDE